MMQMMDVDIDSDLEVETETDSDVDTETDSELEVDQDMEDLLATANEHNIIVTELPDARTIIRYYVDFVPWNLSREEFYEYEGEYKQDENAKGPTCCLCGKEATSDQLHVEYDGKFYVVIFKGEARDKETCGFLQCKKCHKRFHRHKCTLSVNDDTYYKLKCEESYMCPLCVPIFKRRNVRSCTKKDMGLFNVKCMLLLFNAFYNMNKVYNDVHPMTSIPGLRMCLNDIFSKTLSWSIDKG